MSLAQQSIPRPSAGDFGCSASPVLGCSCQCHPYKPLQFCPQTHVKHLPPHTLAPVPTTQTAEVLMVKSVVDQCQKHITSSLFRRAALTASMDQVSTHEGRARGCHHCLCVLHGLIEAVCAPWTVPMPQLGSLYLPKSGQLHALFLSPSRQQLPTNRKSVCGEKQRQSPEASNRLSWHISFSHKKWHREGYKIPDILSWQRANGKMLCMKATIRYHLAFYNLE